MHLNRPVLALFATTLLLGAQEAMPLKLPAATMGGATLNQALAARKTVRTLGGPALSLAEASQLLWAAQGENRPGRRTVPSAHAKYPLELYLVTTGSPSLAAGIYHYLPAGHTLAALPGYDAAKAQLPAVKNMQAWIKDAPGFFVVAGDPSRLGATPLALNLTYYEAGAAAQGLLLQAAGLGLGAGTAAGIDLEGLAQVLKLPKNHQALMVLPVGHGK
jgi:SagB-type dehydrogenase family enzyme